MGHVLGGPLSEDPRASALLVEFEGLPDALPVDRVRLATARRHQAYLGVRTRVEIDDDDDDDEMPSALLDGVTDPWVRTAWGNTRGYRLMLGARYEEAQRVLRETLRELEECRLSVGRHKSNGRSLPSNSACAISHAAISCSGTWTGTTIRGRIFISIGEVSLSGLRYDDSIAEALFVAVSTVKATCGHFESLVCEPR